VYSGQFRRVSRRELILRLTEFNRLPAAKVLCDDKTRTVQLKAFELSSSIWTGRLVEQTVIETGKRMLADQVCLKLLELIASSVAEPTNRAENLANKRDCK
jgi:hypothetical protein